MKYEKEISEKDCQVLQRLSFERNGYDVLIRIFMQNDQEWDLCTEKWKELIQLKNRTSAIIQEIVGKLCDHDYTGQYRVDFAARKIEWE